MLAPIKSDKIVQAMVKEGRLPNVLVTFMVMGAGTDFASKIYATIFAKDNDRGLFVLEA